MKKLFSDLVQKYYFPHIAPRLELYGSRVELIGSRMELISTNTFQSVNFWRILALTGAQGMLIPNANANAN